MDAQFANQGYGGYYQGQDGMSRGLTPYDPNAMNNMQPQINILPPMGDQFGPPQDPNLLNVPSQQQDQNGFDNGDQNFGQDDTQSARVPTPPVNQTMFDPGEKRALQIVLHGVRNHVARSHLRISCALYEEDQIVVDDMGQRCVFNTTTHNPLDISKKDMNNMSTVSATSKMSNKAQGQDIIFKEDHIFMKDVNRLIMKNQGKKDYYLMFQILEKPEPIKIQSDSQSIAYKSNDTANYGGMEFELYGWFLFKLNKAEGGVNVGKFLRKMFAPGLRKPPLDMNKVKTMDSDIEFAVNEVEWDFDQGDTNMSRSRISKKKGKKSKSSKSKDKDKANK